MARYGRDYGGNRELAFGYRDNPDTLRRGRTGHGYMGGSTGRYDREMYRGLGGHPDYDLSYRRRPGEDARSPYGGMNPGGRSRFGSGYGGAERGERWREHGYDRGYRGY